MLGTTIIDSDYTLSELIKNTVLVTEEVIYA